MKLQLPMQVDVPVGQYAQNFLGVADEKLQVTSPMTLSISKHNLSYYNSAGELQRGFFFSALHHNFKGYNALMCEPSLQKIKCEWHQSEDLGLLEAVKCRRTNI
jgi:hypothetical protein